MLLSAQCELQNRYLRVEYKVEAPIQGAKAKALKFKKCAMDCTLEDLGIKTNPAIRQKALDTIFYSRVFFNLLKPFPS